MDQAIQNISHSLFDIAKEANLITGGYEDVFSINTRKEINVSIERDKANFLSNNRDLNNLDKLWDSVLEQKIKDEITYIIKEKSIEHKRAVSFDWRFSAEDVVYNIKNILPELEIVSLGEKQISGDWIETVNIEGEEYKFNLDSDERVYEIFNAVNDHLKRKNLVFVKYNTGGDDYCFMLVPLDSVASVSELNTSSI